MTALDWHLLLPWCILGAAAVASAPLSAFLRSRAITLTLACAALAAAVIACIAVAPWAPRIVTPLIVVDGFSLYYVGLIAICGLAAALLAHDHFPGAQAGHGEFYTFLLLATFGAATIVASAHFISLFLGLEILNVSVYVLIAWRRESIGSIEAAMKYLIPGAVGGAFLLFGMALVYANLGTMGLSSIISLLARPGSGSLMVSTGLLLIAVGIGFKLALAPFHLWTPDVYEGAPVPATAIVATVSKAAVFALFMRYFYPLLMLHAVASAAIATMAVASMIVGNLLAVRQPNLKRIIAYSSIAHMGYFLSAFIAGGRFGIIAATYYLTAYLVTLIVAFGVLSMLSRSGNAETIADIRSLSARSPWLAGAFAVACASFAGLPLAAGFFGKFYALSSMAHTGAWVLAITLVATSGIGIYYYLRIINAMFERPEGREAAAPAMAPGGEKIPGSILSAAVVSVAVLAVLVLGIIPAPLTGLIAHLVGR